MDIQRSLKNDFLHNKVWNVVFSSMKNCFFTIANFVFKQHIGIPVGIYPAPF